MDTFRRGFVHRKDEVLIDLLCHKRNEGGADLCKFHQSGVKGHIGAYFILVHFAGPEPGAGTADIPVAQFIRKFGNGPGGFGNPVVFKIFIHGLNQIAELGQYPFVQHGKIFCIQRVLGGIKLINLRIQNIEGISIPKGTQEFPLGLGNIFRRETVGQPGGGIRVEVPPDSVASLIVQYIHG